MKWLGGALPLSVFWLAPLLGGLAAVSFTANDPAAWRAFFSHPQIWHGLALSFATGTMGLALSVAIALWIAAGLHGNMTWNKMQQLVGGFLSLPHLAFAVGFGFLIMPSGLIARVIALALGWTTPPPWVTTQDPYGFALLAVLVLKEVPFILWLIAGHMQRPEFSSLLNEQARVARSLGHGDGSIWLRVVLPQILPRLLWPMVIVWVYGASVVDMALVTGPTQPPPLAVIIWGDLNNAQQALNARGAAGAVFLTLMLVTAGLAFASAWRLFAPLLDVFFTQGPSGAGAPRRFAFALLVGFRSLYVAVFLLLFLLSLTGFWAFPALLPPQMQFSAWSELIESPAPLLNSLSLAFMSVAVALTFAIVWFETVDERFDIAVLAFSLAALTLPAILIAQGQYFLFLHLMLNGSWFGVLLGHLTPVFAYVFIVLQGPYRAFDPRYRSVSYGLNTDALRFWAAIKVPLLKPPLLTAAAVGIGVSIAQYIPSQLIGSGRVSTLTTEAVTLASGGNRALLAAFSLVLMAIPLLAFTLATRFARNTP